jgi:hypothetical protein
MPLNIARLAQTMDEISRHTWMRIKVGDMTGLKFREDSITDQNLLELKLAHPELIVHKFTQSTEKEFGADWEWWFGGDGLGWICLRIQAKRVHETAYKQLDHGGRREGEYQYQTLIEGCGKERYSTYPFHVFYNGWEDTRFRPNLVFSSHKDFCGRTQKELWGCAAMSSHAVMRLHLGSKPDQWTKRAHVPRYIHESFPWSELFTVCTPGWAEDWAGLTPDQMLRKLHQAVFFNDVVFRGDAPEGEDRYGEPYVVDWALSQFPDEVPHPRLPDYAWAVRDVQRMVASGAAREEVDDDSTNSFATRDYPSRTLPRAISIVDLNARPAQLLR